MILRTPRRSTPGRDPDGVCRHNCLDKENCAHACCKRGLTPAPKRSTERPERISAAKLGMEALRSGRHDANEQAVEDVSSAFFYTPHTLTLLLFVICCFVYTAFAPDAAETIGQNYVDFAEGATPVFSDGHILSTVTNMSQGVVAAIMLFLTISIVALPNGPFIRPHPAVWRVVLGISILYWMLMSLLLFQSYADIKMILAWFEPTLLTAPVLDADSENYASNCDVTPANLWSRVDIFAVAHFLGWVIKAMQLRDFTICWIISVAWEGTEVMFATLLPNFAECWWDQILYDVLICNALGIFVGMRINKYFQGKEYDWTAEAPRTIKGKLSRLAMQFTPKSWGTNTWASANSWRRYEIIFILVLCFNQIELNCFFLKHIFKVPTKHRYNYIRLFVWTVVGCPSLRQFYVYITDHTCKRLGTQAWIGLGIMMTELLVTIKFGAQEFTFMQVIPFIIGHQICSILFVSFVVFSLNYLQKRGWWDTDTHQKKVE